MGQPRDRAVADFLHLGKYYPPEPGGMEQVLQSLVLATAGRLSHDCLVACREGGTRVESVDGATLYRIQARGSVLLAPYLPELFPILHRLRRRPRRAVLLAHLPNPFAVLALALSLLLRPKREPIVVWLHAEPEFAVRWKRAIYLLYRRIESVVLRRVDRFVVATPNHLSAFRTLAPFRNRAVVIPYAVPDSWFESRADDESAAAEIRRRIGQPFVLFVGRLVSYKGLEVLLRAAREIDAKVVIVGGGPLEGELRQRVRELQLEERVELIGRVDDLRPWYLACELLVLPSTSPLEAFGVVQIEAMALGRPVVTSDLRTGVTWVNRDGESGLVVPAGDARVLAAACNRLLADDAMRRRMGAFARERARSEFCYSVLSRRVEELYGELTDREPR